MQSSASSPACSGGSPPAPAMADTRDPAAAEALFEAGRQAATRGDWTTACPKFAESQRLDPAPGTLLNLADCEEHLGHLASAWDCVARGHRVARAGRRPRRAGEEARRRPRRAHPAPHGAPRGRRAIRGQRASGRPGARSRVARRPAAGRSRARTSCGWTRRGTSRLPRPSRWARENRACSRYRPAPQSRPSRPLRSPRLPAPAPPPPAAEAPAPAPAHPVLRTTGFVLGIAGLASLAAGGTTGALALARRAPCRPIAPSRVGATRRGSTPRRAATPTPR